jgi:acyl-[acyl-carrier-protein]-phospholipid O-acyltransferase/long-chain-fatty-acid--[acyl-carrier-protein] ligase
MIKADQTLHDKGVEEFLKKPELKRHLADLCVERLAGDPFRTVVIDHTAARAELKAHKFLAVSLTFAEMWRERLKGQKRVGVVFPAGAAGMMVNFALMMLDIVPVNLNFTAGNAAVEVSLKKANVDTVITAKPVIEKLVDFPWPENIIDLIEEKKVLNKFSVVRKMAAAIALPGWVLRRLYKIPTEGKDREAGLLFSSGSTGEPKGVPLTHKNIIGNCLQIEASGILVPGYDVMMANLPIFHSFGFTIIVWYTLISKLKAVTLPSPLETKRVAKAIEDEKVTIMIGTPTFFRPYFRRIDPRQISSLRAVVGGAEKTPSGFHERWEKRFGSRYLEGYGLTETTPVVSVNLPGLDIQGHKIEERYRLGSVGPLFEGMAAQILDEITLEPQPITKRGILALKGVNVFNGYLDEPEVNARVIRDGWFISGDLARFDEDGYLYIEGRVSRFSKIAGEMVPHGTVEQQIMKAFHVEDSEEPMVAVTGVTDESKGESLVLLSAMDISNQMLRERLTEEGMPNLWIPRTIKKVEKIPALASGKLDLREIKRIASEKGD